MQDALDSYVGLWQLYAKMFQFALLSGYVCVCMRCACICVCAGIVWGHPFVLGYTPTKVLGNPLPVYSLLESALRKHQMLLTVPWVMEYLGAMGRDCFHGNDSSELLNLLFSVLK